jgi:DNA repair exonuclease SbcCD nuclease subunit
MAFRFGICGDLHLSATPPASRKDDYAQTVLGKIRWLGEQYKEQEWDACVIAGDLFHNKRIGFELLHDLTNVFAEFPHPPLVLPGNHDMYYERLDLLKRTPLGYLYRVGVVAQLPSDYAYMAQLVGVPYGQHRAELPPAGMDGLWCVAHAFLGDYTDAEYWSFSDIRKLGYRYVFSGHDHSPHGVETVNTPYGELLVCRPGAMVRVTSGVVDRNLQPTVLSVEMEGATLKSLNTLRVPIAPASEVFSELEQEVKDMDSRVKSFAEELASGLQVAESSLGLGDYLDRLDAPPAVMEMLTRYLQNAGVSLRRGSPVSAS